jgi:ABC-type glycerol-3-phosphate transport system permease component
VSRYLRAAFLLAAVVAVAFPFVWIVLISLKSQVDLNDPSSLSFSPTGANWREVLDGGVLQAALRSAWVGLATVAVSLVAGTLGAYAISRFKAGGNPARFGILLAQLMPPAVLVVPLFIVFFNWGLRDTVWAVMAAHLTFVLPVVTWFMIGFFDAVPRELEEQAMIDGYGRFGLGAAAIFGFVLSWNDLFYALILAGGNAETLPVAISSYNTFRGVELGAMSAAILVSVVPVLIASFFVQKRLVRGISGGGLKY